MAKNFTVTSMYGNKIDCIAELYTRNDRLMIQTYGKMEDSNFREPWATLTTTFDKETNDYFKIKENMVIVKDYLGEAENFREMCAELKIDVDRVRCLRDAQTGATFDVYKINNPELLKECCSIRDSDAIDKAIERSAKEKRWAKETEQVIETGKKFTKEEAQQKRESGEWDDDRYKDAWFSGEIEGADEPPEETDEYETSNDFGD